MVDDNDHEAMMVLHMFFVGLLGTLKRRALVPVASCSQMSGAIRTYGAKSVVPYVCY
jgi:hypothetical protein